MKNDLQEVDKSFFFKNNKNIMYQSAIIADNEIINLI